VGSTDRRTGSGGRESLAESGALVSRHLFSSFTLKTCGRGGNITRRGSHS
jgi:hypothetical protein